MKRNKPVSFFAGMATLLALLVFVILCFSAETPKTSSKRSIGEDKASVKAEVIVPKTTLDRAVEASTPRVELNQIVHLTKPGITDPVGCPAASEKSIAVDEVVYFPDVEAQFCGGSNALRDYIRQTIVYPTYEHVNEIQGRVYVEFVVEADGSVSKAYILKGVSPGLNEEALRVVRSIPKWIPAQSQGKAVRSLMRVPINFKIVD